MGRISGDSILALVEAYARTQPDKLCIGDPDEALTYAVFAQRIRRKAGQLAELGVKPGDRVLALSAQRGDALALMLAVHRLRAVYVPLEKNTPPERQAAVRASVGAELFLQSSHLDGPCAPLPDVLPAPNELATILFTTGTTGVSKGIMLSHRAEVAVAQNVFYGVEMEPDAVELIPMPISHSYGLRHTFGLLLGGRTAILCDGVALTEDFFTLMDRFQVNALSLTPSAVNILTQWTGERLGEYRDHLRYLQLGTAGVDATMKAHLRALLPDTRLYQYYSSTEAGCACIFDFRGDLSPRRVGRPACNSTFAIWDEEGRAIASDETHWGFIACKGPMNMEGYWGDPELTRQTLRGGFVRSQDIGYLDAEGFLCFVGRAGDVINTGGYKVAPEEVESAAMRFGGIRECAVAGVPDAVLTLAPKLYIVPEAEEAVDTAALKAFLASCLEAYKVPRQIAVLKAVPRNFMGKPQRGQCEAQLQKERNDDHKG